MVEKKWMDEKAISAMTGRGVANDNRKLTTRANRILTTPGGGRTRAKVISPSKKIKTQVVPEQQVESVFFLSISHNPHSHICF